MPKPKQETELSVFIKTAIEDVQRGFKDSQYSVPREITFEVSVAKAKKADGKVRLFVLEAGGDYEKNTVQKLSFTSALIDHGPIHVVRKSVEALQAASAMNRQSEEDEAEE